MRKAFLIIMCVASIDGVGQTLFVPSGTTGIGNSSNGHVGIGSAQPRTTFHVYGTTIPSIDNLTPSEVIRLTRAGSSGGQQEVSMGIFMSKFDGADANPYSRAEFRLLKYGSPTNAWSTDLNVASTVMSLLGDGRVGIGTKAPRTRFHVYADPIPDIGDITPSEAFRITRAGSGGGQQEVSMGVFLSKFDGADANPYSRADFRLLKYGTTSNAWSTNLAAAPTVMSLLGDGRVGIGTIAPRTRFHVYAAPVPSVSNTTAVEALRLTRPGAEGGQQEVSMGIFLSKFNGADANPYSRADFRLLKYGTTGNAWGTDLSSAPIVMSMTGDGRVGIGTSNPDNELTVNGTIHAKEVKVDLNVPAPDYVFEEDYNLLPLLELESYITQHKHLPEVPSAKMMEADGLNLKEMNLILLKKVEELTLHLIEKDKQINDLSSRLDKLENK